MLNELPSQLVIRDGWAQSLIQGAALFHVPNTIDLAGAYSRGADTVSGNVDIPFYHFSHICQPRPTPHAPWAMLCLVPVLIGC